MDHCPKGGGILKPHSAKGKQCAFDSFCKKVLRNEARNFYKEVKRKRDREKTFSELSAQEMNQLCTTDDYFVAEQIFNVLGHDIIVTDECIAKALQSLTERKRNIILLSYFLEMTDREIGERLNLVRPTVYYQRKATLQELKNLLQRGQAND